MYRVSSQWGSSHIRVVFLGKSACQQTFFFNTDPSRPSYALLVRLGPS